MRSATASASSTVVAVPHGGALSPSFSMHLAEALAILGAIDRVGRRAEQLDARLRQPDREAQRRLPAELHDHAVAASRPRTMLSTSSSVSGSKYNRSAVS